MSKKKFLQIYFCRDTSIMELHDAYVFVTFLNYKLENNLF